MSPGTVYGLTNSLSFPRVSGDEPGVVMTKNMTGMFSPRERG